MNTAIFHHDVKSVSVGEAHLVGDYGNYCRTLTVIGIDGSELKLNLFASTAEATLPAFEINVEAAA